jgi:hippurate hydrolase
VPDLVHPGQPPARPARPAEAALADLPALLPELDVLYQDLHRNPELSGQERRTAAVVADRLGAAGYQVTSGVGGHGVVGVLRNGDGPTVLLRGDMDALPVREDTGLPYASTATGTMADGRAVPVMHACGHDAHTTCLIGAARLLAAARGSWRGTLIVLAQPAEEHLSGASAMLRDGLYARFGRPDVVLGQHVVPLPAGVVGHRAGPMMAAATALEVTIHGRGGHGSRPEHAVDPIVIAAHTVTRLQTIVSREVPSQERAVVTVGMIRAGETSNVIPDRAVLAVSVRSFDNALHRRLLASVRRIVTAEAVAGASPAEPVIVETAGTAVNENDPAATDRVRRAHTAYFGADQVRAVPPVMGSEDFALYGAAGRELYGGDPVPTVFWLIGMVSPAVWADTPGSDDQEKAEHLPNNHSPLFAPDREPTLRTGVAAMVVAALAYLAGEPG